MRYDPINVNVDVALLRDVMERHGISNVTAPRWLVRHLLSNAAAMFIVPRLPSDEKVAHQAQGVAVPLLLGGRRTQRPEKALPNQTSVRSSTLARQRELGFFRKGLTTFYRIKRFTLFNRYPIMRPCEAFA